jgi:hypothetical protein
MATVSYEINCVGASKAAEQIDAALEAVSPTLLRIKLRSMLVPAWRVALDMLLLK